MATTESATQARWEDDLTRMADQIADLLAEVRAARARVGAAKVTQAINWDHMRASIEKLSGSELPVAKAVAEDLADFTFFCQPGQTLP